jgi:hypothetical protein
MTGAALEVLAWRHNRGRTLTDTLRAITRCDTRTGRAVVTVVCSGGGMWLGQHLTQGREV